MLPISYGDAQPLLAAMHGPVAPADWRGALPITYRLGPGPAQVHLKVAFNWDTKPIYDVIAKITGSTFPDEWIVRGNHHDAWVNGAADPVSGMAPELEEARALGELREAGLAAEAHDRLRRVGRRGAGAARIDRVGREARRRAAQKAVVYINSDGNGRGFLSASGSHTLEHFVNAVAQDIEDPETKLTVWKRLQARRIARTARRNRDAEARSARRPADRRARIGIGLHAVPAARTASPSLNLRLRRRGQRRHLSLDLRRLLPLHAFPRHRLRLRPRAGADHRARR